MTREYAWIPQERENYCVPACLQMVLRSRGLPFDSQPQIFSELGGEAGGNVKLEEGTLDAYFKRKGISLSCTDFPVEQSLWRCFDQFVDGALNRECDVVVSYAYEELHKTDAKANHASLLVARKGLDAVLLDPDRCRKKGDVIVPLRRLTDSMFKLGGKFYCVHPDAKVVKSLETIEWHDLITNPMDLP